MLLLACALTAIVALGMVVDRRRDGEAAAASAASTLSRKMDEQMAATSSVVQRTRPDTAGFLDALQTTTIAHRFPSVALALQRERSILPDTQIVSYYGNPYTPTMGVLGTADLETIADRLAQQAALYDRLNGPAGVVPALHLVYAVAQYHPTDNGLYLQHVDDASVRRYIRVAEKHGMLLFLDIQVGRSSVSAELKKALPYLRYPNVHLAIDPEFAVSPTEVPGQDLGSLPAADIDQAQAVLQALVLEERLPPKLLIVHQFVDSMLRNGNAIQRYPGVQLIIDMDGFGPAAVKRVKYERYATRPYASYAAIKLFFDHDPDLMSEQDVLSLEPRPAVVIYQ